MPVSLGPGRGGEREGGPGVLRRPEDCGVQGAGVELRGEKIAVVEAARLKARKGKRCEFIGVGYSNAKRRNVLARCREMVIGFHVLAGSVLRLCEPLGWRGA